MLQSVLMADDSVPLHALVRAHLEPNAMKLYSAFDGESALCLASSIFPKLILLDVDLPRVDGFEVCRKLKANQLTADVPLIFLTADACTASKLRGLNLGAADYITKPFKPEDFQSRVESVMRSSNDRAAATIIDPVTGLWSRESLESHFPIRAALAEHCGQSLACMVSDVDHFGSIHARYGDAAVNELLSSVAEIFRQRCRAKDAVFRLDGSRFAILMTGPTATSASNIADRLRIEIQRRLRSFAGVEMNVTCSFGISDTRKVRDGSALAVASAALTRAIELRRSNWISFGRQTSRGSERQ